MNRREKSVAVYCIIEIESVAPVEFRYFKIGVAANPSSRLRELQTGSPRPLALLIADWFNTRGEAARVERRAHQYLAEYTARGEWFRHVPEEHGCPFEALSIAGRHVPYFPASDLHYDNPAPSYNLHLISPPQHYPGKTRDAGGISNER